MKTKVIVLVPMEKSILYESFISILNLFVSFKEKGIEFTFFCTSGMAHAFARNKLFQMALDAINKEKDFTHVLWIDSDHTFLEQDVYNLMEAKEEFHSDIMGAGYLTKNLPISLVALKIAQRSTTSDLPIRYTMFNKFELNKVYSVDALGFGMVLMGPEVLTKINDKFGDKPFEFPLREDIVIGEDVCFCEKAKALGMTIDCNTGVMLGHMSTFVMDVESALKLMNTDVIRAPSGDLTEIPGWLSENEGLALFELARKSKGNIIEIGSFKGKSTVRIALGLKSNPEKHVVYAVDPHTGSKEHKIEGKDIDTFPDFIRNINKMEVGDVVIPIKMKSEEASKYLPGTFGVAFIDGSHEYEDVSLDFKLWWDRIIPGGTLAMHDLEWPGVAKLIEEIKLKKEELSIETFETIENLLCITKKEAL